MSLCAWTKFAPVREVADIAAGSLSIILIFIIKSYGDQRISLMTGRGQMSETSTRGTQKKAQETKDSLVWLQPWDWDGSTPPRNYYKPSEAGDSSVQAVNI